MDKIVMPQVEEVLRRAVKGETVKQMVEGERRKGRKVRREADRK